MPAYLRIDTDTLHDAIGYPTVRAAVTAFRRAAEDLDNYSQACEASIHLAPTRSELVEYPDYVLALGPRGGVRVERA